MGNKESSHIRLSNDLSEPEMNSVRYTTPKRIQSKAGQKHSKTVVASIDFGTTYSGYAYAYRKEFEKDPLSIHLNDDWKRGQNIYKAPTTILFTPEKKFHSFGFKAEEEYTKLCQKQENNKWFYFKKFKMQLYDKLAFKKELILTDETGKGMKALYVFTEAIRFLKGHILETFERRSPGISEEDIFWVLTIPAIWTEAAKQFMIEAGKQAGIPRCQMTLCLEPEAAALFCKTLPNSRLHGSKDQDILKCFQPGGRYIILDLGGGTVDTAVHEVRHDGSLIEIHKSSGGDWGGCRVDEEFYSYVKTKYGNEAITGLRDISPRDWLDLLHEFEVQKRSMTFEKDSNLRLKLPTRLLLNSSIVVDNQTIEHLYVGYEDFVTFFEPTTEKIANHIAKLLSRVNDIKLILMVGGFAESNFVRQSLENQFRDLRIIVPHDSSLSVMKGAVIYGFNPTEISARVCRFTYGIRVNKLFVEGVHPEKFKEVLDGETVCRNVLKVLVNEGDVVDINSSVEHEVTSTHRDVSRRHIQMVIPVFVAKKKNVLCTTEDGCEMLGKITIYPPLEGWPPVVRYRLLMEFGRTEFRIRVKNESDKREFDFTFDFLG